MSEARKNLIVKEITLWKKRYTDSKKVFSEAYKELSKDAKKAYKEAVK